MSAALPISTSPQPARLTARDFWVLADAGAFSDFVKAELIEGELRVVNAVHSRHARVHAMLAVEIGIALKAMASPLILLATPSVELGVDWVPEPDLALVRRVAGKVIAGADVALAVEISDTTLEDDLGRKQRLYAAHGIAEYWVTDVERQCLHQMWSPRADGYAERREVALGARVEAATIAGLVVETSCL